MRVEDLYIDISIFNEYGEIEFSLMYPDYPFTKTLSTATITRKQLKKFLEGGKRKK